MVLWLDQLTPESETTTNDTVPDSIAKSSLQHRAGGHILHGLTVHKPATKAVANPCNSTHLKTTYVSSKQEYLHL